MGTAARAAAAVLGVVLLALAVWQLRAWTQTSHVPVDADSQLRVVIDARTNRRESGQSVSEMASAKVQMCRLEVRSSDPAGFEPVPDAAGRFRFLLRPTLDEADRTQFRGCLEDWNVDHILVKVIAMEDLDR